MRVRRDEPMWVYISEYMCSVFKKSRNPPILLYFCEVEEQYVNKFGIVPPKLHMENMKQRTIFYLGLHKLLSR